MYAGSTLTKLSGNIIGAHQKIDRIARKHLEDLIPGSSFPLISDILHFEGDNGPDSIKRKSPAINEPWHFIQPFDNKDTQLIDAIENHYDQLVRSLKKHNVERSAFEAAWLAHAIVDGLTPAHHYPYEEQLKELRNGEGLDTRSSMKKRLFMSGVNKTQSIKNNWRMWGPRGLFTTHASFEIGFATIIAPLSFSDFKGARKLIKVLTKENIDNWFRTIAQEVAKLRLYDDFYKNGWTLKLSHRVKDQLAPTLIDAVTSVWYCAYKEAFEHKS